MTNRLDTEALDLAPLLARRELWLLVSVAMVDPYRRERLERVSDPDFRQRILSAARLLAQEQAAVELGPGEGDPRQLAPEALFAAFDAERDTLETTYRRLFGLTVISTACPPCEVEYEPNADVAFRSQQLADVAGFYQAFGLQVASRAEERLDHIVVEAEFLYLLLAKEAAARQAGNQEGTEVCDDARRKFFQEHVGWWLPVFSRVLARTAGSGYYRELADFMAALSALERTSLQLPPFPVRTIPRPSKDEAPGACVGCVDRQELA